MEACKICSTPLNPEKVIICSGTCGHKFHFNCVGLNKSHLTSWTAGVGLFWFCESCRLNFEPAVYDREKLIMKALRELLIRMDSMDTRLGNYGENLRKINSTIINTRQTKLAANHNLCQSTFHQTIDDLNLDDTEEDQLNRTRSCDETSFFEILDDINTSMAQPADKFVVGNKRVQILQTTAGSSTQTAGPSTQTASRSQTSNRQKTFASVLSTASPLNSASASTRNSATASQSTSTSNSATTSTSASANRQTGPAPHIADNQSEGDNRRRSSSRLMVAAKAQLSDDMEAFYITPFSPEQLEDDIMQHICDISNSDPDIISVKKRFLVGKL